MTTRYDYAIAGAGIVGLAHAYHLAKRGRKVVVFERSPQAQGASVRNFGMIWPIGQSLGEVRQTALRSREIWREVLADANIWHEETGSLHLAYHEDELQVLREFLDLVAGEGYQATLLSPAEVGKRTVAVKQEGLLGAMWSADEICIEPRRTIAALPAFLARRYGVEFQFGCPVTGYQRPLVLAGGKEWRADQLLLCAGDDIRTLYPDALQAEKPYPCKLQMMRSAPMPASWKLGPMLAAGLTLRHYQNFQNCPTLPELKARFAKENPDYDRFGIHVMASQTPEGEITIGDSHEYGDDITPFDKQEIDDLILDYLKGFLEVPDLKIASHWHGVYLKHPSGQCAILHPDDGVTALAAIGGTGMTLSFGIAERVLKEHLNED